MKKKNGSAARGTAGTVLSISVLVAVAVLLVFSVSLVRTKLLQNASNLGMALVQSFAVEEELNIAALERTAMLASQYVEEIDANGGTAQEIQECLSSYLIKLTDTMGEGIVDPYVVINGSIIAANPWEGDGTYDYADTQWYQQALAAEGQVVCGDVYEDAITGQRIFTISRALAQPGDVFAMDVYIQNKSIQSTESILPEHCSYYLCDQDGALLYCVTDWDSDDEQLQRYADYLMERIRDGSLSAYDATYEDEAGVVRGAYYQQLSNGWTVIMTIPLNSILMGEQNIVVYALVAVSVVLFLALSVLILRDALKNRRMKKADDTIHILGDSFYAIFRVNFQEGVYEGIKIYEDLQDELPRSGDYCLILQAMCRLVKSSTYQEFQQSFSLESIRQRVAMGISDYGGDFQRRFGDDYRWVNIRSLYDAKVAPDEVILCFRDVDTEKRQELQHTIILQEALDAAKKGTKAKSDFFSRMSHDMRTPLGAIIGCCKLARKSYEAGESDKVDDYIRKIDFAGNQLLALINDILELSRTEAGKATVEESSFDLRELLDQIASLFRDRAQEEHKSFEVSLDLKDSRVVGDHKKVSQILNNLISNAVKYTNPGDSIRLEARQFAFQTYNKYQIIVEDTGIGMSESFKEHLFDPYSRETTFSAHATVGTGLGMPIVKSLVQQLSGEISVESTLGKGSRFTVTIPLRSDAESAAEPERQTGQEPEEVFDWTGRRILVAEDNELNREIITELLEQLGASVLPAVNGLEAVQLFAGTQPYSVDAILMDMQMPEMDGCQAASAIRALDRADAGWVPIIAVTANVFAEDIDKTTKAGMNGHVSKPIDIAVLTRTVQKLVKERGGG